LQIKKLYSQDFRDVHLKCVDCYTAGSDTPRRNKRGSRPTAKQNGDGACDTQ